MSQNNDRAAFLKAHPVSRETETRLDAYAATLTKWQAAINLVSDSTLDEIWTRHFQDCAQLLKHLPTDGRLADLGAGAGFPGLVLTAMTDRSLTLVEADSRKCAFLSTAARAMGINNRVLLRNKRVERLEDAPFDLITARAFAPLPRLLTWSKVVTAESTQFYLLKGASWEREVEEAQKSFTFELNDIVSETDSAARILHLTQVRPL